ncbi:MAG: RNA polymerase sigma-70 factor [Candidatus Pedobacter colombiensis]|uniref:RNA polymerase sigma-70 factor n=1 Tax=Candidatus Pedobacter colombiensis TaxID=3121371 RepID=A0AAJ5W6E3_9SPHI|nr:RNA polymerase sigma-70 factor [Pedobacter sp.]WEK18071.1 MAG: RNA polymerase sigma-70 factor [Pedobacter sp.]
MLDFNYKILSDAKLIKLLQASDHNAYTEIYNRYFQVLFVQARKKLKDEDLAKDILQEIFAKIWIKRETHLIPTNLTGYLYTLMKNRILDLYLHQQVEAKYIQSLKGLMATGRGTGTDARVREKECSAHINKEIAALPPKMRQIFELSRKKQLTYKEIAAKLNTNENNVSKQINNGLKVLRRKLIRS